MSVSIRQIDRRLTCVRRIKTYTQTHRMTSCEEVAALRRQWKRTHTALGCGPIIVHSQFLASFLEFFTSAILSLIPVGTLNHESPIMDHTRYKGPGGRPTGGGNALRRMGTIWMSVFRKTCITTLAHARVQNCERTEMTQSQGQCTSWGCLWALMPLRLWCVLGTWPCSRSHYIIANNKQKKVNEGAEKIQQRGIRHKERLCNAGTYVQYRPAW